MQNLQNEMEKKLEENELAEERKNSVRKQDEENENNSNNKIVPTMAV